MHFTSFEGPNIRGPFFHLFCLRGQASECIVPLLLRAKHQRAFFFPFLFEGPSIRVHFASFLRGPALIHFFLLEGSNIRVHFSSLLRGQTSECLFPFLFEGPNIRVHFASFIEGPNIRVPFFNFCLRGQASECIVPLLLRGRTSECVFFHCCAECMLLFFRAKHPSALFPFLFEGPNIRVHLSRF